MGRVNGMASRQAGQAPIIARVKVSDIGEFRLIQRVGDMHIPRVPLAEPLALQCRHFVDCIQAGTEPVTDFEDAARVVEVLEAASASHANGGARVAIPDLR